MQQNYPVEYNGFLLTVFLVQIENFLTTAPLGANRGDTIKRPKLCAVVGAGLGYLSVVETMEFHPYQEHRQNKSSRYPLSGEAYAIRKPLSAKCVVMRMISGGEKIAYWLRVLPWRMRLK